MASTIYYSIPNSLRAQALLTPRFNASERAGLDYWLEMNLDNLMGFVYDNVGGGGGGAVNSVTGTLPVVATGTTNVVISMAAAGAGTDGYLTSANWNTFNNKQELLVNTVNIKSINGESVLGSGNIVIASGGVNEEEVQDIVATMLVAGSNVLLDYDDTANQLTISSTATGSGGSVAWDDVTGKPATFPPSSHVHAISEVTNLQTTLDGKAPTVHTHTIANVTGLQTALDGKADDATTLAGYGITDAYTKTASDANYPTKAGVGATGTWSINVTGNAGTASTASSVAWAGVTSTPTTISGYGITDAYTKTETDSALATKQPIDADLTSIAGLAGTSGLLRKTAANTWSLDTSSYSLVGHSHAISDVTGLQTALDSKLALAGGTMVGPINWAAGGQTATLDLVPDPLSSTGDVFNIESDAGVQVKGPYVVLDTTNLQITMPGARQNAAITVAAIDAYGVVSLGYTALPEPAYSVLDTTNTPVLIKAAGATVPTAWVSLGLSVTLAQDIPADTGNVGFEGIFVNDTTRLGTVEFGLRVNGAAVSARDIVTQISPHFNQTIAMSLPLINDYANGDLLELMARVTINDNNAFQLTMANSDTDLGAMRIYTTPSSGGGGTGTVNSVGGVAPVVSSGGTDPQISMPAATASVSGYLSAANFVLFNGKANAATTLAGYGITDAYTKTASDANYPTRAGVGATGTWGISISGVAASASAVAWGNVTDKPDTIAGYGITDCYTKVEIDGFLGGTVTLDTTQEITGYKTFFSEAFDVEDDTGTKVLQVHQQDGSYGSTAVIIDGGNRTNQTALKLQNLGAGVGGFDMAWAGGGTFGIALQGLDLNQNIINKSMLFSHAGAFGTAYNAAFIFKTDQAGVPSLLPANVKTIVKIQHVSGGQMDMLQFTDSLGTPMSWIDKDGVFNGTATNALSVDKASSVADLNNPATDVKQWIGTQAQYDELGSWGADTFYNITDAETPSEPGGGGTVAWDDVTGKPTTFPPSAHVHPISEVTNLQTTLDGKAAIGHGHAIADVSGLQTALDGKAATSHTHTTAQITGLDTALAAKAPLASPVFTGNPTAPTATVGDNDTTLATTAFVNAEIANDAPTKTGGGASGTWPISISGDAATATAVNDNGAGSTMKFWYGTESEYQAIVTKDPSTIYFRSA